MDESEIYVAASKFTGDQRAAFLKVACGEDEDLRRRINERLLQENSAQSSVSGSNARDQTEDFGSDLERTEDISSNLKTTEAVSRIGAYRLTNQIGQGGMGTVWLAEQQAPVQRKVALKIIKAGMDTEEVIARFEAERQALARMNHPNIARVLDAGATEQGRPFFVMEFVAGTPITEYCDTRCMPMEKRLELFCTVCHAVQHAHHKGIIHRDIKPSNVLVAEVDGEPLVKVIDFGLAKATDSRLTEKSVFTQLGQMLGTPAYMSPEQADAELDIDMRTDVYSLGVLMYELVTGAIPIDVSSIRGVALKEIQRLIREHEPPRMSHQLSSQGNQSATTAGNRASDPRKLVQKIRGDLDIIAMKALEKDRRRRYETPDSFAADVQRYLNREIIEARPASTVYRMQKFWARNRVAVSTAGLVLVAIIAGTGVSVWQAIRANKAAISERTANQQAQKRLVQIENGAEVLGSIFQDIDLRRIEGEGQTLEQALGERLKDAAEQLVVDDVGDQSVTAKLQTILGQSLHNLGHFDEAISLFEDATEAYTESLGPDDRVTLAARHNLAECYVLGGEYKKAIAIHEDTLERSRRALGESDIDTVGSMKDLGNAYIYDGRFADGIPYLEEALRLARKTLGEENDLTMTAINSLAFGYHSSDKMDRALPLHEEVLRLRRDLYGPDHYDTMTSLNNLATTYYTLGEVDKALPLMKEVYELRRAKLGAEHPHTTISMANLAVVLEGAGKREEALPFFEESLAISESKNGMNHPSTLIRIRNLANCCRDLGDTDRAMKLYKEYSDRQGQRDGTDSLAYADALIYLGFNQVKLELWDEAEPVLRQCLELRKKHLADDDWRVASTESLLGAVLVGLGDLDAAESLLISGYEGQEAKKQDIPSTGRAGIEQALKRLIAFYENRNEPGDAENAARWQAELTKND